MMKIRKELRALSIAMFGFAGIQIYNLIYYIVDLAGMDLSGFKASELQLMPYVNALAVGALLFAIAGAILMGVKGLREAKAPTSARFHINIAKVIAVFATLAAAEAIVSLFSAAALLPAILELLLALILPAIVFAYIDRARKLRRAL